MKNQKGCSYEHIKLSKKQLQTKTPFSDQTIGEMSVDTLRVTVYNMRRDMVMIDTQITKAFVHLQNAMS